MTSSYVETDHDLSLAPLRVRCRVKRAHLVQQSNILDDIIKDMDTKRPNLDTELEYTDLIKTLNELDRPVHNKVLPSSTVSKPPGSATTDTSDTDQTTKPDTEPGSTQPTTSESKPTLSVAPVLNVPLTIQDMKKTLTTLETFAGRGLLASSLSESSFTLDYSDNDIPIIDMPLNFDHLAKDLALSSTSEDSII